MDNARRVALMWRWSLLTAAIIALFWGVWHLAVGSVPALSEIKMTDKGI